MKNTQSFLLGILCISIISCKSPTQTDQTAVDDPPVVTISGYTSILTLGDTLRLSLHASASKLTSGMVNYSDSTVIYFTNLKSVFDTTLVHVFKTIGSRNIAVSFTNGDKTTTKQITLTVCVNPPPVVTLVFNKTAIDLDLKDTLKVTLHASDSTLSNGYLDFKDGTVVTFSHINHTFDTTIAHVYSIVGTYSVTATFSDGQTATSSQVVITVNSVQPFVFPLQVGETRRYYHTHVTTSMTGLHTWKVIGTDGNGTWNCVDIRVDTAHFYNVFYNDTISFIIQEYIDYYKIEFPEWMGFNDFSRIVPKNIYTSKTDTLIFSSQGHEGYDNAIYVNDVGLVDYSGRSGYMAATYETLSLIDYSIPLFKNGQKGAPSTIKSQGSRIVR